MAALVTARKPARKAPAKKPTGRRPLLLKPNVVADIANGVSGGIFPHVAAGMAGVSQRTYYRYMERGREADETYEPEQASDVPSAERPYWQFWHALTHARAVARASAENRVFISDPLRWLKEGPGRDHGDPAEPGWTAQVALTGDGGPIEVMVTYENDWRDEADQ